MTMSKSPGIEASAVDPDLDIDPALQADILTFVKRIDTEDHYSLLGVPHAAQKSEIKKAYFDLMNIYHSDRFYGKKLGAFGPMLLRITEALTRASDTLGRNKTRAEYDRYLESRQDTLGARLSIAPDAIVTPTPPQVTIKESPRVVIPEPTAAISPQTRLPRLDDTEGKTAGPIAAPPSSTSIPLSQEEPPSSDALSSPSPSGRRPAGPTSAAARKLLARKMGLRAKQPSAGPHPDTKRQAVRADLKARYEGKRLEEEARLRKWLEQSEQAKQSGDWSTAVSALRLAAQARPDDGAIQLRLAKMQEEADRALAPRFIEQAKYEEREGQYSRAARSFERAARGKESAQLFNRGAECLLQLKAPEETDVRMSVDLARSAVRLEQQKATYRITLARAYYAAGMKTSALGELQRCLELEPENLQAKSLLKALK